MPLTRRRFIAISAGAVAASAGGLPAFGHQAATWHGVALGASASIRIDGRSPESADGILRACVSEIRRLEAAFSLYRKDSALSRLNRNSELKQPPPELLALMSTARGVHRATGGAFDPTVQPLWELYARHFRGDTSTAPSALSPREVDTVLARVGLDMVIADPAELRFRRPGMAITLNGIAQGYITDRVADLLRSYGLSNVLVNLGEIRALGGMADGRRWRVKIAKPASGAGGGQTIDLADLSIATSATNGTTFDEDGQFGHILDPRTGYPAPQRRQLSVVSPSATLADAYSTAFCLLPAGTGQSIADDAGLRILDAAANT